MAQALKLHSPTYGSTSTRAELEEKYERLSTDLLDETLQYVAAAPVARKITFDGSPGHFSASKSTSSANEKLSTYQMASRTESTLYMSSKSIAAYEKTSGQTVLSVLRETNIKNQQMAVQQGQLPKCWGEFDSITGPSDSTIEKTLAVLDKKFDWLAVTAAACAGMLVIKIDADLNLEGKQCCIRYQCVNNEMLQFRFNPFSKYMNDYLRKHRTTHVFIPASVLVAQDLRIGQKILETMHDQTRQDVTDKARSLAARQQNITDSSDPYITVPDILTAALRLGYRPDQDAPRKRELIKVFIERPKTFMTIDQLEARFRRTENEYSALSGDKDTYHVGVIDKMDTWLEWIRDRTWAPHWIQETTRKREWPDTIEEVFAMTREMAQFEVTATEMDNYAKLYPADNQISAIGSKDARVMRTQGHNIRNTSKRPGAYSSKPYDRRGAVQRGAQPQNLQQRANPARATNAASAPIRRMLNRYERNTITMGKVTPEPGAKCPRCDKDRCRGRCWHCLKPETCADPPQGHTAKDCPFKDVGINDVARWDPEWKKQEPHKPCFKCGNVGHPDHACPNPIGRRLLVRLVKDLDSGRWVNQMVAVCTLKDGLEQPDDDIIDHARYDIHLTGESEYTACGSSTCGTDDCGKGHAVDIAHIYRPEQKQKVENISTEDYINHVLQGKAKMTNASDQSEQDQEETEDCFDIAPIFDILQRDDEDSELVALGKLLEEDDRTLWDTGAMRHLKRTVANAQGYIREPIAKLHGAQGVEIPSEGEATFETLHETETGVPHTMLCDASICPQAPNITSAGVKFKEGYKAVHNMQGVFVPTQSSAYERVMRALNRRDLHLLFNENEHWVITPSYEKIRLHELKKNLFYLKRIEPTPVHETEHLKDMRQDPRYTSEQVSMIRAQESITHDCELPHYIKEVQKIVGDYESLARQVAHLGAFDETFGDLMIATLTQLHEVSEHLQDPQTRTNHTMSVQTHVERVQQTALKLVCNRCKQAECEAVHNTTFECKQACATCGSTAEQHKPGYACEEVCKASRVSQVVTDYAANMLLTGRPDIECDDELERDHAAAHAECESNPCAACKKAETPLQPSMSDARAQESSIPIAHPVPVHVDDDQILRAFQSLTTRERKAGAPTQSATILPALNDASVCTRCRRHFTGCQCLTPAQEMRAERKGKGPAFTAKSCVSETTASTCAAKGYATLDKKAAVEVSPHESFAGIDHDYTAITRPNASSTTQSDTSQNDSVFRFEARTTSSGNNSLNPKHHGHARCTRSDDGNAGSKLSHDGDAKCIQSDGGNAGSALQHNGNARCSRPDNGNAGSTSGHDGNAKCTQSEKTSSDRKRKDELTTSEMLQLVHTHAWMHVMDDAVGLPSVLGMPAQVWLTVLPQEEQAHLAVHYQSVIHATTQWEHAVQVHGLESSQSGRAARQLHDVQDRKLRYLQHCTRKAEMILSAGGKE